MSTGRQLRRKRFVASTIDLVIAASFGVLIADGQNYPTSGRPLAYAITAMVLVALILFAVLPASFGGWTPGMRLSRLRVTTVDGAEAGLDQHLVRTFVGIVDLAPFVVPGLVGLVVAGVRGDGRRLGDVVAGTKVDDCRALESPLGQPGISTSVQVSIATDANGTAALTPIEQVTPPVARADRATAAAVSPAPMISRTRPPLRRKKRLVRRDGELRVEVLVEDG